MLQIKNLNKLFGKFKVVDNLNLEISKGSIFGFVGPNGAGKTTTMKIMVGLLSATSGEIYIDGINITENISILKDKIGYMPDFFGVYDNIKVNEYMDFYAGTYYIPYSERKEIIDNLLEIVDLTHKKNAYVDSLSRGMKQRLCLARSLIHDPDILILDEPASGLDPRARLEMKEILKQLKSLNKTIIISSHILYELSEMCTEIGIINNGKIVEKGSISEIMNHLSNGRNICVKPIEKIDKLITILKENPNIKNIIQNTDEITFSFDGDDKLLSLIINDIVKNDIPIVSFKEKESSLEDIFMQLTNGGENN